MAVGGQPTGLFDLSTDPTESRNLLAAEPERVAGMAAELAAWLAEVRG